MFLDGTSSSWLLLAGMAVLIWVMMRRLDRRRNHSRQGYVSAEGFDASRETMQKFLEETPRSLSLQHVQMQELARDLRAEIDTKLRVLQQLILQAEQQAARLEAAVKRAEQLGISECADVLDEIQQVSSQSLLPEGSLEESLEEGKLPLIDANRHQESLQSSGLQRQILDLAKSGHGAIFIAEQVGRPLGEVELTLSLHGHV